MRERGDGDGAAIALGVGDVENRQRLPGGYHEPLADARNTARLPDYSWGCPLVSRYCTRPSSHSSLCRRRQRHDDCLFLSTTTMLCVHLRPLPTHTLPPPPSFTISSLLPRRERRSRRECPDLRLASGGDRRADGRASHGGGGGQERAGYNTVRTSEHCASKFGVKFVCRTSINHYVLLDYHNNTVPSLATVRRETNLQVSQGHRHLRWLLLLPVTICVLARPGWLPPGR